LHEGRNLACTAWEFRLRILYVPRSLDWLSGMIDASSRGFGT
jgi:hypothetical protein